MAYIIEIIYVSYYTACVPAIALSSYGLLWDYGCLFSILSNICTMRWWGWQQWFEYDTETVDEKLKCWWEMRLEKKKQYLCSEGLMCIWLLHNEAVSQMIIDVIEGKGNSEAVNWQLVLCVCTLGWFVSALHESDILKLTRGVASHLVFIRVKNYEASDLF